MHKSSNLPMKLGIGKILPLILLFAILPHTASAGEITPLEQSLLPEGESHMRSLAANEPHVYEISTENYSVYAVEIMPMRDLKNVRLTVNLLAGKPRGIAPAVQGILYKYLDISWSGLPKEDIAGGLIRFRVSRDWLASQNCEDKTAVLWRWDGSAWQYLVTRELKNEETYWHRYYESQTIWFSTFAITLTSLPPVQPPAEEPAEPLVEEVPVEELAPPPLVLQPKSAATGAASGRGPGISPISILFIFALVGVVLIYFNVIVKIRESKDL